MQHSERAQGFTLLEVIIALTIFSTVMGMLLQTVSQNVRALSAAEREIELMELARERVRQIQSDAASGQPPELGSSAGAFDSPWEHLRWELLVEPFAVRLPNTVIEARLESVETSSRIFGSDDGETGADSPLRLVVLRIYDEFGDEPIDPFVILTAAVDPPLHEAGP